MSAPQGDLVFFDDTVTLQCYTHRTAFLSHGLKATFLRRVEEPFTGTDLCEHLWRLELDVVEAKGEKSENRKEHMAAQRAAATATQRLPVYYGSVLQIRNVSSGLYLGFDREDLDPLTGGLLPLSFVEPTRETEFQLLPDSKARTKGELLRRGDRVKLVHNRTRMEVRTRPVAPTGSSLPDIVDQNLGFIPVEASDKVGHSFLLQVNCSEVESQKLHFNAVFSLRHLASALLPSFKAAASQGTAFTLDFIQPRRASSTQGDHMDVQDFYDWVQVESLDAWRSGNIRWADTFRLRHMLSGKYITFTDQEHPEHADPASSAATQRCSKKGAEMRSACQLQAHTEPVRLLAATLITYRTDIFRNGEKDETEAGGRDITADCAASGAKHEDHFFMTSSRVAELAPVKALIDDTSVLSYYQTEFRYETMGKQFTRRFGPSEHVLFPVPSDYAEAGGLRIVHAALCMTSESQQSTADDSSAEEGSGLGNMDTVSAEAARQAGLSVRCYNVTAIMEELRAEQQAAAAPGGNWMAVDWIDRCVERLQLEGGTQSYQLQNLSIKYTLGQFMFKHTTSDARLFVLPRQTDNAEGVNEMLLHRMKSNHSCQIMLKELKDIEKPESAVWQFRPSIRYQETAFISTGEHLYWHHPASQCFLSFSNTASSAAAARLQVRQEHDPDDLWRLIQLKEEQRNAGNSPLELFYDTRSLALTFRAFHERGVRFDRYEKYMSMMEQLGESFKSGICFSTGLPWEHGTLAALQELFFALGFGSNIIRVIASIQPSYKWRAEHREESAVHVSATGVSFGQQVAAASSKQELLNHLEVDRRLECAKSMLCGSYELLRQLITGNPETAARVYPYYIMFMMGRRIHTSVMDVVFEALTSAPRVMLNFTSRAITGWLGIARDSTEMRGKMFRLIVSPMRATVEDWNKGEANTDFTYIVLLKWAQHTVLRHLRSDFEDLFTDYSRLDENKMPLVRIGTSYLPANAMEGSALNTHLLLLDVVINLVRLKNTSIQEVLRLSFPLDHIMLILNDKLVLSSLKTKLVEVAQALYVHIEENQPVAIENVFVWDKITPPKEEFKFMSALGRQYGLGLMRWMLSHIVELIEHSHKLSAELLQEIAADLQCVQEMLGYGIVLFEEDSPLIQKCVSTLMALEVTERDLVSHNTPFGVMGGVAHSSSTVTEATAAAQKRAGGGKVSPVPQRKQDSLKQQHDVEVKASPRHFATGSDDESETDSRRNSLVRLGSTRDVGEGSTSDDMMAEAGRQLGKQAMDTARELHGLLQDIKRKVYMMADGICLLQMNERIRSVFKRFSEALLTNSKASVRSLYAEAFRKAFIEEHMPFLEQASMDIVNSRQSAFATLRSALMSIIYSTNIVPTTMAHLRSSTLIVDEDGMYARIEALKDRLVPLASSALVVFAHTEEVEGIMMELTRELLDLDTIKLRVSAGRSLKPNWAIQEIMRALRLHKYTGQLYIFPGLENHSPRLMDITANFIQLFMYKNTKNKVYFNGWLRWMARTVTTNARSARVMGAVFDNNDAVMKVVTVDLARSVCERCLELEDPSERIPYMRLLMKLTGTQKERKKVVQSFIMEFFVGHKSLRPAEVNFDVDTGKLVLSDDEVDYLCTFAELLASTAARRKDHNLAFYRRVLPLGDVLEALVAPEMPGRLMMTYWTFVRMVYIEADVHSLSEAEYGLLPRVLDITSQKLRNFSGMCQQCLSGETATSPVFVTMLREDPLCHDNPYVRNLVEEHKDSIEVSRHMVEHIIVTRIVPLVDGLLTICVESSAGLSVTQLEHSGEADSIASPGGGNSSMSQKSIAGVSVFNSSPFRSRSSGSAELSSYRISSSDSQSSGGDSGSHGAAHKRGLAARKRREAGASGGVAQAAAAQAAAIPAYRVTCAVECQPCFRVVVAVLMDMIGDKILTRHLRGPYLAAMQSFFYARTYLELDRSQVEQLTKVAKELKMHTQESNASQVFNAAFVSQEWQRTVRNMEGLAAELAQEDALRMLDKFDREMTPVGTHNVVHQLSMNNAGYAQHILSLLGYMQSLLLKDNKVNEDHRVEDIQVLRQKQLELERLNLTDTLLRLLQFPSTEVVERAFDLLARLLEGGNERVQQQILDFMENMQDSDGSSPLLVDMDSTILAATSQAKSEPWWMRSQDVVGFKEDKALRTTLRFIQELCEGHNLTSQNVLRGTASGQHNVIMALITYLDAILPPVIPEPSNSVAALAISKTWYVPIAHALETLIETAQGPCRGNQDLIAQNLCLDALYNFLSLECSFERTNVRKLGVTQLKSLIAGTEGERQVLQLVLRLLLTLTEGAVYHENMLILGRLRFGNLIGRKLQAYTEVLRNVPEKHQLYESVEKEATTYYILLKHVASVYALEASDNPMNAVSTEIRKRFEPLVGRVEVMVRGENTIVFFRKEPTAKYLTRLDREEVLELVDRSNPSEKVESFVLLNEELDTAVRYRAALARSPVLAVITHEGTLKIIRRVGNVMAVLLNILLLLEGNKNWRPPAEYIFGFTDYQAVFNVLYLVLGLVLFWQTLLNSFSFMVAVYPVRMVKQFHRVKMERMRLGAAASMYDSIRYWVKQSANLFELNLVHLLFMSATAFLGVQGSLPFFMLRPLLGPLPFPQEALRYFFAAHLLDIIVQFTLMKTVLRSVTKNWVSLFLTCCLIFLVIYYYAIFAFVFFPQVFWRDSETVDPVDEDVLCYDILSCFLTLLGQIPSGSDYLRKAMLDWDSEEEGDFSFYFGTLFQISFFFLVLIVLLNILFGIIVDTFSQIRSERENIERDNKARCFVCSIDATSFDRNGTGFEYHQREEHPIWDYTHFHSYVKQKRDRGDQQDFSGPETHASLALSQFPPNINLFPIGEASSLTHSMKNRNY